MRWFVIQGKKTFGPFEPDQLRTLRESGKLRPDHHLRAESGSPTVAANRTTLFTKDGVDIETGDHSPTTIPRVVSGVNPAVSRKIMSLAFAGMIAVCLARSWFFLAGGRRPLEERNQQTVPLEDGPRAQMEKLHAKINDWKTAKDKLTDLIADMDQDRQKLMQELHKLGVSDPAKSSDDPRVNVLLRELKELSGQLSLLQKKHENYDLAVFKSESRLRTLERRLSLEDAGLADAELDDLTRTMLALDESLTVESASEIPIELDETLTKELADFARKKQAADAVEPKASAIVIPNSPPKDSPPQIPFEDGWTYLALLPHTSVHSQFGRWSDKGEAVLGGQDGRPLFGKPLIFNGRHATRGIYLHADSSERSHVTYRLGRRFSEFQTDAFIPVMFDHQGHPATPLVFKVVGDGRVLWKSKPLSNKEAQDNCAISVVGIDNLSLEIDCPGPNNWCLGAWAEPRLKAERPSSTGRVATGNVALASRGAVATGPYAKTELLLDGRPHVNDNYAKALLNVPVLVTLPDIYQLQRIRINLIAAWLPNNSKDSYYGYKIEVSPDGSSFELLADRTTGRHRDWQEIEFPPRPVKAIRITGTYDHPHQSGIRIAEVEAYCTKGK